MNELYTSANFKGYTTDYIYSIADIFQCSKDNDIELVKGNVINTLN